ncbi:MAG: hypothetical protein RSC98_11310, partial [Clostridia bacterium]
PQPPGYGSRCYCTRGISMELVGATAIIDHAVSSLQSYHPARSAPKESVLPAVCGIFGDGE